MKPRFQTLPPQRLPGLLLALWVAQAVLHAEPPPPASPAGNPASPARTPTNVVVEIPQSVFLLTSTTQAIRDPFFPNSTRLAARTTTKTNAGGPVVVDLVLKAIFGTPDRPLATINNATFGPGEEQDVVTPAGRIRVRCLEVRLKDETVLIEAAGSQRELRFQRRK